MRSIKILKQATTFWIALWDRNSPMQIPTKFNQIKAWKAAAKRVRIIWDHRRLSVWIIRCRIFNRFKSHHPWLHRARSNMPAWPIHYSICSSELVIRSQIATSPWINQEKLIPFRWAAAWIMPIAIIIWVMVKVKVIKWYSWGIGITRYKKTTVCQNNWLCKPIA